MSIFLNIKKRINTCISHEVLLKIKRLWVDYIFPQRKLLVFSVIFMVMFGALEALSVNLLKPIFDELFIAKKKETLGLIAVQVVFFFGAKCIASYMQSISMTKLGINFTKKIQSDLYEKVIIQDLEFFYKRNSGNLLVYFVGDLNAIKDAVLRGITTVIKDAFSAIFLIALMFWKSFNMAIVVLILFPLVFYPIVYFGKKIKKIFSKQQISFSNLYSLLTQSFQGIKIVKSYNMEKIESQKIEDGVTEIANLQMKLAKNSDILSPLMEFFGGVTIAASLIYGGYRIMHGCLTVGDFMVFLLAIVSSYKPLKSLANFSSYIQVGITAIDRVFTVMDQIPKIVDKPNAKIFKATYGVINISGVKFGYIPGIEVLRDVNLEVDKGEKIALVGSAGSGKSTLINLILRFYDVWGGSIKIDDEDIRDVGIRSLRDNIAFVSQDVVLFNDTIKNNILMGKPSATSNEAIEASKRASVHDFIISLERGYDTFVGERGSNLSGGQKQMISIARAMLKNAPILLLDEATSSLDSVSERMVQEGLEVLMKDRTSIVVAHRLSTIINSNRIYVFESGNVVESGTHKELLGLNGYYTNLYNIQFIQG
ncbi:MAG: ABC transporter ATP-binding protein/permease [Endomicrobium sp.]|jgi:subfamily B ATP-binding cassette protein MsbA|nr:ABC transporter ATP-binding protein/permease [Endomicrobium sp.]